MSRVHRRWPRSVGIAGIVAVNIVVWATWVGRCDDYAGPISTQSRCITEPAVGLPGAILIAIISATAIIVLTRSRLSKRP